MMRLDGRDIERAMDKTARTGRPTVIILTPTSLRETGGRGAILAEAERIANAVSVSLETGRGGLG